MNESTNNEYRRSQKWRIILAPLGNTSLNFYVILMTLVSYIAAGGYGIAIAVAGIIATSTRVLDAVVDPFLSVMGDRLDTRFGRIRIMMGLGYILQGLSILTMFIFGVGGGIVQFILYYCIYIIGRSIYTCGYTMVANTMTDDPSQRMIFSKCQSIYTAIGSVVISIVLSNVIAPMFGGLSIPALQAVSVFAVTGSGIMVVLSMIAVSPYDKMENFKNTTEEKVSLKDIIYVLRYNKPLWAVIAAACSDKLAMQAASSGMITTMVYGIIIGNYAFQGNMSLWTLAPQILLILFAARIKNGKTSNKALTLRWTKICIGIAVVMVAFLTLTDPTKISSAPLNTAAFLVIYMLYVAARNVTNVCSTTMRYDCIDYQEYISGKIMPSTIGGIYNFMDNLISSLGTTIVGFCMAAIGYVDSAPQIGDPSSPALFWMCMFCWMGIPILGWITTIIALRFYDIDEKLPEIKAVNRKRREEAKGKTE